MASTLIRQNTLSTATHTPVTSARSGNQVRLSCPLEIIDFTNRLSGDGDGDQATDYFDRVGPPLPMEQRWRLFQVSKAHISQLA